MRFFLLCSQLFVTLHLIRDIDENTTMTFSESYMQMKAFARVDGAKLGVFWIISFALFIAQFTYPFCGMLWMATMIFTPFYIAIMTRQYAVKVLDGKISYRRAYAYSVWTTFYGALILAIAQWVYFQYMDHGFVIGKYVDLLGDKDFSRSLEALGYQKEEMKKVIEAISSLRPIDISLQILWSNFVAGLILSLTTALYASRR